MSRELIIENAVKEIAATANKYPAVVMIHDISDWRIVWMSENGLKYLGLTLEKI